MGLHRDSRDHGQRRDIEFNARIRVIGSDIIHPMGLGWGPDSTLLETLKRTHQVRNE